MILFFILWTTSITQAIDIFNVIKKSFTIIYNYCAVKLHFLSL